MDSIEINLTGGPLERLISKASTGPCEALDAEREGGSLRRVVHIPTGLVRIANFLKTGFFNDALRSYQLALRRGSTRPLQGAFYLNIKVRAVRGSSGCGTLIW